MLVQRYFILVDIKNCFAEEYILANYEEGFREIVTVLHLHFVQRNFPKRMLPRVSRTRRERFIFPFFFFFEFFFLFRAINNINMIGTQGKYASYLGDGAAGPSRILEGVWPIS